MSSFIQVWTSLLCLFSISLFIDYGSETRFNSFLFFLKEIPVKVSVYDRLHFPELSAGCIVSFFFFRFLAIYVLKSYVDTTSLFSLL